MLYYNYQSQARHGERKKKKMKKSKKIILYILGILAIIVLIKWSSEYTRQQIIKCVEGGNTVKFCQYHLGK